MSFVRGSSALVVVIAAAEPLVGEHRARHDRAAAVGVPAHVTVLHPWLPLAAIDPEVLAELARLVAQVAAFDVVLARTDRFPGTTWLAPEPAAPFARLTGLVWQRWPEAPPYEGMFEETTPHLTVAQGPGGLLDRVDADLVRGLAAGPVRQHVDRLHLIGFDGARWTTRDTFRLG